MAQISHHREQRIYQHAKNNHQLKRPLIQGQNRDKGQEILGDSLKSTRIFRKSKRILLDRLHPQTQV